MILLNGEDNANAHLKRQVMGREVIVAFTNGKLNFGPWEQVFYGEFDGRRNQRALKNINLYAKEKTVTAFIGSSGCGKTTLLRGGVLHIKRFTRM